MGCYIVLLDWKIKKHFSEAACAQTQTKHYVIINWVLARFKIIPDKLSTKQSHKILLNISCPTKNKL